MSREVMTREERLWSAIKLEKPDHVPVDMLAGAALATAVGGTVADWYFNWTAEQKWTAVNKIWDYTGGWDLDMAGVVVDGDPIGAIYGSIQSMGVKMKFPGVELPDNYTAQAIEEEVMTVEDYDTIAEIGWKQFMDEQLIFRLVDFTQDQIDAAMEKSASGYMNTIQQQKDRGVVPFYPSIAPSMHPFFRFSMSRSMLKFMEDLFFRPAVVEKALKKATQEYIEQLIMGCQAFDSKLAFVSEERAPGGFFSLPMFERFWWPYTQEIVEALWSEGIVTWFHLDQCWNKNIPYFKKLPRGSAILALDGTTNIFAAKEVLRNHLCLAGDVSASLISLGKTEDVEAYVKKLIDEVGDDGGFILGTACEMATEVKLDNWRAMIQTARNYEYSKR